MGITNKNRCWICGALADSSEHRIKKSDMVRSYGRGPYSGPDAPVHVFNHKQTNIRGPNAAAIKYRPSLCARCNNCTSQPWDIAYDTFVRWVLENERTVLARRLIDFADVYGDNFGASQCDLFKYFVKSIGCRFANAGVAVPQDLVALLPKEHFMTALKLSFAVNEDVLSMPKETQTHWLAKGDMLAWKNKLGGPGLAYSWHESVSWLTVSYWYALDPDGQFGCPWIANSRHLYLGWYQPLPIEQRAKLQDGWGDPC